MKRRAAAVAILLATLAAAAGVAGMAPASAAVAWADAEQLLLVRIADWDASQGTLRRYAREDGAWRAVGAPVAVSIGRHGAAWGLGLHAPQADGPQKREGDGRAPAGVFALGTAFGYAAQARTGLDYAAMDDADWCIDVPTSPHYNRIVDAGELGPMAVLGSTEPMRRDLHAEGDPRYRLGIVIEHNPRNLPGAGSCIFAHLWRAAGEPTAGCTAMADADLEAVLEWLDRRRRPVFALLPEAEYRALRDAWGLPAD